MTNVKLVSLRRLPATFPFPASTPKPLTQKQLRDEVFKQAPKSPF
jgi:hypothetical protein